MNRTDVSKRNGWDWFGFLSITEGRSFVPLDFLALYSVYNQDSSRRESVAAGES